MKTVRRLSSVIVLTLVLGVTAFAGQIETPPCADPVPGQIETPPCLGTAPTDPPNSSTAMAADPTFTEIATEVLESMLSIF